MGHSATVESKRAARPLVTLPPATPPYGVRPTLPIALPLTFTLLLLAFTLLPGIRSNPNTVWSFCGTAAFLLAWEVATFVTARRFGRRLALEVVLRPQHYLQACAHFAILAYWGWYWREVYDSAPLIAAQLVFAYAFDALLTWTRRDTYTLGFGPFPIVFSTNLFLWFKPDWFYLQFLMLAVGFAAKELIRWNKDGRQTHIFNPSSFTLTVFSLTLLLTGATSITWGPEIAVTQLNPPHIYLLIFLVSLPAQFLFGTAPMTLSAVATTYGFGLLYFAATGTHFWGSSGGLFQDPIPIAVFLGMHLLFTDPSTSPRTELGRIIFGMLYGLSVVALFALFVSMNLPSFYDKLLPVPILNLLIQGIDKAARSNLLRRFDFSALGSSLKPRQRNVAYTSVWIVTFITMQFLIGTQTTLTRGDVLREQGRTEEAIATYREFVQKDPSDARGYERLGRTLMQAGQLQEAMTSFQRATELQPDTFAAHNNLGLTLMQVGRPQDAAVALRRAAKLQPNSAEVHEALGRALMQAGRAEDAIAPLRRAIELQPRSPTTIEIHHGLVSLLSGRAQDGITSLQRAVELEPDSPGVQRTLGVALMQAGRPLEAVVALQRASELQPNSADVHAALGQALMEARRPENAAVPLRRAVELQPDSPAGHNNLGVALIFAGQTRDAVVALQRAVELKTDYPEARFNLALALAAIGERTAAIGQLHEVLRARPDWRPALAMLSDLEAPR
jgi:Flp pilus assembly protein TadD